MKAHRLTLLALLALAGTTAWAQADEARAKKASRVSRWAFIA